MARQRRVPPYPDPNLLHDFKEDKPMIARKRSTRRAALNASEARAAMLHAVARAVGKELRGCRQELRTDLEYDMTWCLAGNVGQEAVSLVARGVLNVLPDKTRKSAPATRKLLGVILANLPARTRQNLIDVIDERMRSGQPVPEEFDRMAGNLLDRLSTEADCRGEVKWAGALEATEPD